MRALEWSGATEYAGLQLCHNVRVYVHIHRRNFDSADSISDSMRKFRSDSDAVLQSTHCLWVCNTPEHAVPLNMQCCRAHVSSEYAVFHLLQTSHLIINDFVVSCYIAWVRHLPTLMTLTQNCIAYWNAHAFIHICNNKLLQILWFCACATMSNIPAASLLLYSCFLFQKLFRVLCRQGLICRYS